MNEQKPPIFKNIEEKKSPHIKEGVDFVFEKNTELETIGTKEQYSEYLDAVFPESNIKNIVWHHTSGDWFKKEAFSVDKTGSTDEGYYGKGFYFSTQQGLGSYGNNLFGSIVNVKNPKFKLETHTVTKQILSGMNKEESKNLALAWLDTSISWFEEQLSELEKGIIQKHSDIPKNVDFEQYWESERLREIKRLKNLIELYQGHKDSIDALVDETYSHDGFLTGKDFSHYEELLVKDASKIHILGSQSDIEGFKKFVEDLSENNHK